ncbi:MAG: thiamine biosynthesis protein ThiS [Magnetovibrio sp.]|nr:thiamine biosynthesis protein ThiS [Magnetovibrio sp.]|tara:strand:- start:166 stop:1143 length:978 start_codon:yes stop_codon:yes gene_type:complete
MKITINGEVMHFDAVLNVEQLLVEIGFDQNKVAVERNLEIVPKSSYTSTIIKEGDKYEIVHFIGGGASNVDDPLVIDGRKLASRLIIGTGKYESYDQNRLALEASGAEMVTVAVRRVNLTNSNEPMLIDYIDPKKYIYLPNTAGCFTKEDALRTLRLAREAGGWTLVKLEVLGDERSLYPRMIQTLEAAEALIDDGFKVMVYCSDDPMLCKELEDMGCVAIMPLGAPIGSGLGIQNPVNIRMIVEQSQVPVIVDAGVGTATDAAFAMELGCDGVLMNTAIASAKNPILMARAMKHAVIAGRDAYLSGRMPKKKYADPSSPLAGLI